MSFQKVIGNGLERVRGIELSGVLAFNRANGIDKERLRVFWP
jgi:hypothetical protein